MEEKGITLGLDMGTNSLGWAVVDNSTNDLVSYHGHPMWGVRMFSESSSAEDRRKKRGARRRYQRRRQRILLLREIFQKEICDKDPYFFYRMDQAFYVSDDRTDEGKGYFLENQKATKDFYNKYPTIWHLRYDLVTNKEKKDIRLVYLAIHHILKYRGNFLHEGAIELSAKPNDELNMFISCISSTYEGNFEKEEDDDNANWDKYFVVEQINNDKFIDSLISIIDNYLDRSKKLTEVVDPSKKRYELFADELIRLVGESKNILTEFLPDALFKGTLDLSKNRIYKEIYKNKALVCTGDLINPLFIGFFSKDLTKSDHFMCQNCHLKQLFHLVIHWNSTICIDKPKQIQPVLKIIPVICWMFSHEPLQVSMDCVYWFHRVVIV